MPRMKREKMSHPCGSYWRGDRDWGPSWAGGGTGRNIGHEGEMNTMVRLQLQQGYIYIRELSKIHHERASYFLIGGHIFFIEMVPKILSALWLWVYKGNSAPVPLSDRKY